ncbi:MAG: nuclear transport factor 2 family protein [Ekhidna sp.]|uniref:nuclear transport factor 2 family protein n=1 Tax=Ekhidna sp. TaxID=2608089 RepID=UPI0032EAF485
MSKSTLEKFYQSFQKLDAKSMAECYHEEVVFNDPVFKNLDYAQTTAMWDMLIKRSNGNLEIDFHTVMGDDALAQCIWEAEYEFSKTGNPVHNIIHCTMEFKDGLIIRHTDEFDFWRWSKMALGLTGVLLGWSPMIKNRVRKIARMSLDHYLKEKG